MSCAALAMILAIVVAISHHNDEARLSSVANAISASDKVPSGKAIAILQFVYHDQGFHKNPGYFVFPQFGPTAVQVLENGGDCADKSRLLVALLKQAGIESTPVMLFDDRMHPTHTVVEAEVESGQMELDPVYDLFFPRSGGGFYGSAELRSNSQVLRDRLERMSLVDAKARYYHIETSGYSHASTFNWEKTWYTRAVKLVLLRFYGDRVYQLRRPSIIEDPKLLVAASLAAPAVTVFVFVALGNGLWTAKRTRRLAQPVSIRAPRVT